MKNSVSVIIAVKNSALTIRRCIDSVLAALRPGDDIIVVDDGSTDSTPEILRSFGSRIRLITNTSSRGPAYSRNLAVKEARGELVAFTDGDCIVDKNWLSELSGRLSDCDVVSAGGVQKVPDDDTEFSKLVGSFLARAGFLSEYVRRSGPAGSYRVNHNASCNVIYRRESFLAAGGFLQGLWPGEDVDLDRRLVKKGGIILFVPAAVVYHYRAATLKNFVRMMVRYGWAQAVLVRLHGFFRPVQFVPLIGLAVIASFLIFGSAAVYIIHIAVTAALIWSGFNIRLAALGAAAFAAWNWGFLKGMFFPVKGLIR